VETLQQTQTLSLRISEVLRKRLEDIRKLTALRKGESVSTSEIAKQLLDSSREERFGRARENKQFLFLFVNNRLEGNAPMTILSLVDRAT
jgi:hypothetical protein